MAMLNCPSCAATLRFPDSAAGKKIRCPKCKEVVSVPAGAAIAEGPPAAPKSPPAPRSAATVPAARKRPVADEDEYDDDEYDDDDDDTPSRKRGKKTSKNMTPILIAAALGGVLLLAGLAVGGYFLFSGGSSSTDTSLAGDPGAGTNQNGGVPGGGGNPQAAVLASNKKYLPDDSAMIFSVRFASLMASPALQKVRQEFPMLDEMLKKEDEFQKQTGVSMQDLDSLLFSMAGNMKDGVMVVRLSKNYTTDAILPNVSKSATVTPIQAGSHTIHSIKPQFGPPSAICLPEPQVLLISSEPDTLTKVLQRNGPPNFTPQMQTALSQVNFGSTVAGAMTMQNMIQPGMGGPGMGGANQFMPEYGTLELTLGSSLEVKVNATFKDEKSAKDVVDMANGALAMVKLQQEVPSQVKDLLNGVRIEATGPKMTAQANLETDKLIVAIKEASKGPLPGGLPPELQAVLGGGGPGPGPGPGPQGNAVHDELKLIGLAYHNFHDQNKRGPRNVEELRPFLVEFGSSPPYDKLKDGTYVFMWDVKITEMTFGTSNTILAYPQEVPTQGGFVLFGDGSVRLLDAAKFQNTKLARPLNPKPGTGPKPVEPSPPAKTQTVKKDGPFKDQRTFKLGDRVSYVFPVEQGKLANFHIKALGGAELNIQVIQNLGVVAKDSGLKEEFKLQWIPAAAGECVVEITCTDVVSARCILEFTQQGSDSPTPMPPRPRPEDPQPKTPEDPMPAPPKTEDPKPMPPRPRPEDPQPKTPDPKPMPPKTEEPKPMPEDDVIRKNGSFSEALSLKYGDKVEFEVEIEGNKLSNFTLVTQKLTRVSLTVLDEEGERIGQDKAGPKNKFMVTWLPKKDGKVKVLIYLTDTKQNTMNAALIFQQISPNQPGIGQPGGFPGQPGGFPGQPGQPGGFPGQPGQPGGFPGQPGIPPPGPVQPGDDNP